ncbi:hypothetical protein RND81_05G056600 [Saponaria officinalis]|uniref:Uncharacterized protein n=1 Tax=Saponaria officinalis TaxID=3572 RepID=A0AAW1KSW0_SAPOF
MSTATFGRSKSGDRFYNPPARRQLQQQFQQQNQQHQHQHQHQQLLLQQKQKQQQQQLDREEVRAKQQIQRRQKSVEAVVVRENSPELDDGGVVSTSTPAIATTMSTPIASVFSSSLTSSTNLDRFLEYTTPSVSAQYFSKTSIKGWRSQEEEFRPYFVLGDLWESFKEWSAYGAEVPLLLNGTDCVKQYYVPYLSGIQLYVDPSKPSPKNRRPGEESDESFRETSSDGSSDCEQERGLNSFGAWPKEASKFNMERVKGLSLQEKPFSGSSSDEGESSTGDLVFEYFEHNNPFGREPLADKISLLASRFPELMTYRSCDLTSSSWISVAWYPIYRIPTGPTLQNLETCFLTFHYLSTPVTGGQNEWQCHFGSSPSPFDMEVKRPLPIFGMACYKFKISMWEQNDVDESPKANSLLQAADEWLRQLNVNHPDYRFFASHKQFWR